MAGLGKVLSSTLVLTALIIVSNGARNESWAIFPTAILTKPPWFTIGNSTFFNFQVKACNETLSIELIHKEDNTSTTSYTIVIGFMGLGRRQIKGIEIYKSPEKSKPWAETDKDDFLNCDALFNSFWISWTDGDIKVGTGINEREGQIVLQKKDDNAPKVNVINIKSIVGYVVWKVELQPSIAVKEIPFFSFITTEHTNFIILELKACGDVTIFLDKLKGGNGFDEMIINLRSNGTNSIHRSGLQDLVKVNKNVLSCEEYDPFWISWSKAMVKMGTGYIVGTNTLMRVDFKRPDNRRFDVEQISIVNVQGDTSIPAKRCPVGFWYHPTFKSCYNFIYAKRFPYKRARSYCKRLGGYLAVVESQEESDFIKRMLKDNDERADLLLNAKRSRRKSLWVWKDQHGTLIQPFNKTDWRFGEPNNPKTERCIAINTEGWNDIQCSYNYQFICEAMPL